MSKLTIIPKRLWVYFGDNSVIGFPHIGVQHRIAWPPAEYQTCHHTLMFINNWKPHYRKEVV